MTQETSAPSVALFHDQLILAQQGCQQAAGTLLNNFYDCLLLRASQQLPRALASKADACDFVQQTFVIAFKSLPQFRGHSEEQFFCWLLGILRNEVRCWVRSFRSRQKRNTAREQPLDTFEGAPAFLLAGGPNPVSELVEEEDRTAGIQALNQLSDKRQEVLCLHRRDGLSFRDVGARLGISEDAARLRFTRALQELGRCLRRLGALES